MDYIEQLDKVIKPAAKKVKLNKVTVLTGKNGSGKSLVRKLVGVYLNKRLKLPEDNRIVAQTSLQQRTESRPEFGALSSAMHDSSDMPTSYETFNKIEALLKICSDAHKRFIVIDEPEIGMGEEMIAALVIYLNKAFKKLPKGCLGVLIITHNRYIVENLKSEFINLEGMNRKEWLTREIVPTNIEVFQEESLGLFRAIQKRISERLVQ